MPRERRTLTREEAAAFTQELERRADALGIPLEQWILKPGKPNDIRQGPGPRFAIVQEAQAQATLGRTYGHVLGSVVIQGNGERYRIRIHDLAGFVCANGYCEVVPPGGVALPTTPSQATPALPRTAPGSQRPQVAVEVPAPPGQPHDALLAVLRPAYPCEGFQNTCPGMRWDPPGGHIPRGFLGATGRLEEVELVMVLAEPGDPRPGDHETLEDALAHARWAFREGTGQFHVNARYLFDRCWPGLSFEEQLRRVWITESVLCSAEVSTGPVPKAAEQACGIRFLRQQLAALPGALVVAFGAKAADRLHRLGIPDVEQAFALGKPGCFQSGARPSWDRIADLLANRRLIREPSR